MRDVLAELLRVVASRRDRRRRHRRRHLPAPRPRPPGASMLVGPDGDGRRLRVRRLRRGRGLRAGPGGRRRPAQPVLQRYGVSDDDAFAVGLTCGGILDVFVETVDARDLPRARRDRRRHRGRPAGRGRHRRSSTPTRPGSAGGSSSGPTSAVAGLARLDRAPTTRSPTTPAACSASGTNATLTYGPDGERRGEGMRVFVCVLRAAAADAGLRRHRLRRRRRPGRRVPRLPRDGLRRPAGVRHATRGSRRPTRWSSTGRTATSRAEVEAGRVDARTVICVLTHDPKFDVPLLEVALRLPEVAYVGAMGSRRTHEDRLDAAARGRADRGRARPGCPRPIGLDLGARTPEETAVASPPRSSRCAGAARARGCADSRAASTTDAALRSYRSDEVGVICHAAVDPCLGSSKRSTIGTTAPQRRRAAGPGDADDPDQCHRRRSAGTPTTSNPGCCSCSTSARSSARPAP